MHLKAGNNATLFFHSQHGVDRGHARPIYEVAEVVKHDGHTPAYRSTEACSRGLQRTYLILGNVMVS